MSIALASEQKAINVSADQKMALWDYGVWNNENLTVNCNKK